MDFSDKYSEFLEWFRTGGGVMPKCEYPAFFENGVCGVRCIETIENREAYIFVPYKMTFSPDKLGEHPVLRYIIMNYPDVFKQKKEGSAWAQLTMTLGILFEIVKGRSSYWYPWLRQLPDAPQPDHWSSADLDMLQDDAARQSFKELSDCIHS